ncbi:MAG TPA: hypothetical protein VMV74_00185 [Bacteroidales bacterium]|nr:hypothetical protein [Bacteroidales bacterium]
MKKTLTATVALLFITVMAMKAQGQDDLDRLTAYKIAFFTQKLSLTSAEAEKFWPVYNDYSARKSKIQLERVALMRYAAHNEANLSEQELSSTADILAQSFAEEANLIVTFNADVKKILPPAKVIRLFQSETQYKLQLLRELNQRRQEKGPGQGAGGVRRKS